HGEGALARQAPALARSQEIGPLEGDTPRGDARRRIEKRHDGIGGDGFARPALPHHGQGLAAIERQPDAVERMHHPRPGSELDRQILDLEKRRLGPRAVRAHMRFRGSITSRHPSPRRLKQKTASISAKPGKSATHHPPETMKLAPSATMIPHSGVGGRTPSPMKESPAALRMA